MADATGACLMGSVGTYLSVCQATPGVNPLATRGIDPLLQLMM
jgi:hypothetical protein